MNPNVSKNKPNNEESEDSDDCKPGNSENTSEDGQDSNDTKHPNKDPENIQMMIQTLINEVHRLSLEMVSMREEQKDANGILFNLTEKVELCDRRIGNLCSHIEYRQDEKPPKKVKQENAKDEPKPSTSNATGAIPKVFDKKKSSKASNKKSEKTADEKVKRPKTTEPTEATTKTAKDTKTERKSKNNHEDSENETNNNEKLVEAFHCKLCGVLVRSRTEKDAHRDVRHRDKKFIPIYERIFVTERLFLNWTSRNQSPLDYDQQEAFNRLEVRPRDDENDQNRTRKEDK